MLEIVGSPVISVLTLSNYDIGAGGLVWTVVVVRRGAVSPAPATAPSAFGELGGNGVPPAVGGAGLLADDIRPVPVVRIDGGQFGGQPIAFFRRPRKAAHPLHEFGVPVAQAGGFRRAHSLTKWRIIVGHLRRGRCGPRRARV